jgi:hypothetical protein
LVRKGVMIGLLSDMITEGWSHGEDEMGLVEDVIVILDEEVDVDVDVDEEDEVTTGER